MNEQRSGRTRTGLSTVQVFSAKGKANDKTMSLWEFIEDSKDLFRLEWLSDFSYKGVCKSPFPLTPTVFSILLPYIQVCSGKESQRTVAKTR